MRTAPDIDLITKYRDSAYGELSAGDRLTIHPPHRTGWDQELPSYTFELLGFERDNPKIAYAAMSVDGTQLDEAERIDFELLENWMVDRTAHLTDDQRYAAVPIYLQRAGSDHTEVV